jgi:hypothetical protein
MKHEDEIRRYRDSLVECMERPCHCSGDECWPTFCVAHLMMEVERRALTWALGEAPESEELVEWIVADAARQPFRRLQSFTPARERLLFEVAEA